MNYEFTSLSLVVVFLGLVVVSSPSNFFLDAFLLILLVFIVLAGLVLVGYGMSLRKTKSKFVMKEVGLEWTAMIFLPIILVLFLLFFNSTKLILSSLIIVVGLLGVLVGLTKPERKT